MGEHFVDQDVAAGTLADRARRTAVFATGSPVSAVVEVPGRIDQFEGTAASVGPIGPVAAVLEVEGEDLGAGRVEKADRLAAVLQSAVELTGYQDVLGLVSRHEGLFVLDDDDALPRREHGRAGRLGHDDVVEEDLDQFVGRVGRVAVCPECQCVGPGRQRDIELGRVPAGIKGTAAVAVACLMGQAVVGVCTISGPVDFENRLAELGAFEALCQDHPIAERNVDRIALG